MPGHSNPNGEHLEMVMPLWPNNPLDPESNHPIRDRIANM